MGRQRRGVAKIKQGAYREPKPEAYVIHYEDAGKVAEWHRLYPDDPEPEGCERSMGAATLDEARRIGRDLLARGHGCPRIHRREGVITDGAWGWVWEESFVEDC